MTKKHDIIWLESVDSTNDQAKRDISVLDNLSVLSALTQTGGRGQKGNTWSSEPGQNLLFSVVLKFNDDHGALEQIQAYDQFVISEITALSVVDLLSSYRIEAKIKWPNDIYVCNRKICGILIENALKGKSLTSSIVGIGLNVNQKTFDPSLPNPISMAICGSRTYDMESLLEEFMEIFTGYLDRYCNIRRYGQLRTLYLSQMWRLNEKALFIDNTKESDMTFEGTIRGLSEVGHLIIENNEGELKEFAFKEMSYII